MNSNHALAVVLSTTLLACGARTSVDGVYAASQPGVTRTDAGTTVVVTTDARTTDTGTTTMPPTTRDASTPPGPGTTGMPGTCGRTVYACLCRAVAQGGGDMEFGRCVEQSMSCSNCLQNAQEAACPAESTAYNTCADNAVNPRDGGVGCMDQDCLDAMCNAQINAYNDCLSRQQEGSPYAIATAACIGDLSMCQP